MGLQDHVVRAAQLASNRQMSGQVSRGSGGEYQADEQAGVAYIILLYFIFDALSSLLIPSFEYPFL